MPHKIGIPTLKLNNINKKGSHCGGFQAVAYEALEERKGLDYDIDSERADLNIFRGFRTAAELIEYSERHLQELRETGHRIRKDAVVMCTTVFKPPAVYMNSLPREQQIQLLSDCSEFLGKVVGEENIKSEAFHFDEQGGHLHVFWEPITKDGRLCAKEIHNALFFTKINEQLPAFLRDHGWDIADADCYERAQDKVEALIEKRRKFGRSSAVYKAEAEKQKQEILDEVDRLSDEENALRERIRALEETEEKLKEEVTRIRDDEELAAAHESIQLWADTLESLTEQQQETMEDLQAVMENPLRKNELPLFLQNALYIWERLEQAIRKIIQRIRDVLTGILQYRRWKEISVPDDTSKLEDRLLYARKKEQERKEVIPCVIKN